MQTLLSTNTSTSSNDGEKIVSVNNFNHSHLTKETKINYEEDLKRRQKQHLETIKNKRDDNWRPCLHDSCPSCIGTGRKKDGSICIHAISCPCPKCSPHF